MTDAAARIARLLARGVEIWPDGGRLRYRASKRALTAAVLAEMAAHKDALVSTLNEIRRVEWPSPVEAAGDARSFTLRTRLAIDAAAIGRAVRYLALRHPALRTTADPHDIAVHVHGYLPIDARTIDERLEPNQPLDLRRGPTVRARIRISSGETTVVVGVPGAFVSEQGTQQLAGELSTICDAMAAGADPSFTAAALEPRPPASLSEDERRQILVEWNRTSTAYPHDASIHALFAEQARLSPDRDALRAIATGETLTYGALNRRANQLARHLAASDVSRGSLVGIAVERSLDLVVSVIGVLKAGAAYVPLEAGYPAERLDFMLRDTAAPIVIADASTAGRLPRSCSVFRVDADWALAAAQPAGDPAVAVNGDDLAYVMYTSGSTGSPKGIDVTHRNVVRLARSTDFMALSPDEVFLQLAPISFDASTLELWAPLLNGGRLVVMPPGTPTVGEIARAIREHGVTAMWLTAGLFHLMVDEQLDALAPLGQLLAGGDVLSVPHVRRVLQRFPHLRLINGYGPTENTTFTCCHTIPAGTPADRSIPIGRPIANTRVYVLDEAGHPVPAGVPGELYAAGDGIARGYRNRPELTAERFVRGDALPHLPAEAGATLFRTGDLVRWLPDGTIEFLGRLDDQIKIRGFRVEPGEIESLLVSAPAVRAAVVVAREDLPGQKTLAAYVVPDGDEIEVAALRRRLQDRLPDYMVPSTFTVLSALPLGPNGKVDRRALPVPESAPGADAPPEAPRTAVEAAIADVWRTCMRRDAIGVHENFFELGGHSLIAAAILSRLQQIFRVGLSHAVFFNNPTIAQLAAALAPDGQAAAQMERRALLYQRLQGAASDLVAG